MSLSQKGPHVPIGPSAFTSQNLPSARWPSHLPAPGRPVPAWEHSEGHPGASECRDLRVRLGSPSSRLCSRTTLGCPSFAQALRHWVPHPLEPHPRGPSIPESPQAPLATFSSLNTLMGQSQSPVLPGRPQRGPLPSSQNPWEACPAWELGCSSCALRQAPCQEPREPVENITQQHGLQHRSIHLLL